MTGRCRFFSDRAGLLARGQAGKERKPAVVAGVPSVELVQQLERLELPGIVPGPGEVHGWIAQDVQAELQAFVPKLRFRQPGQF